MREIPFSGFHALGSFTENEENRELERGLKQEKVWNNLPSGTRNLLDTHGETTGKFLNANLHSWSDIETGLLGCKNFSPEICTSGLSSSPSQFPSMSLFPPKSPFPFLSCKPFPTGSTLRVFSLVSFGLSWRIFQDSPDLKEYDSGLGSPWGEHQKGSAPRTVVHQLLNFLPQPHPLPWSVSYLNVLITWILWGQGQLCLCPQCQAWSPDTRILD